MALELSWAETRGHGSASDLQAAFVGNRWEHPPSSLQDVCKLFSFSVLPSWRIILVFLISQSSPQFLSYFRFHIMDPPSGSALWALRIIERIEQTKWIITECAISWTKGHRKCCNLGGAGMGGVGMQKKMLLKYFSAWLGKQSPRLTQDSAGWPEAHIVASRPRRQVWWQTL